MPAHNILANTIIGFVLPSGKLLYVTKNYEVADIETGQIVSTGGSREDDSSTVDAYANEVASHTHAVYGRDIAAGISMTVAKRNAKLNQNRGIAVSTMRIDSLGNTWSIVDTLSSKNAVRLMHKWFIEHGLMDLYISNRYTAISGFQEWVCGDLIEFFSPENKLQWYRHAMNIDYEMEKKARPFTMCMCDVRVPNINHRNVIPNKYYDQFGLFNYIERMTLWAKGKPQTEAEADMILHAARLKTESKEMSVLMERIAIMQEEREKREAAMRAKAFEIAVDACHHAKPGSGLDNYTPVSYEEFQKDRQHKSDLKLFCEIIAKVGVGKLSDTRSQHSLVFDGPTKYVDPFRGAEEEERLATHQDTT